ncbi:hypothetical protein IQ07DRAFT_663329, partial [Pyrenochaeta sp. DS3sAY3a]
SYSFPPSTHRHSTLLHHTDLYCISPEVSTQANGESRAAMIHPRTNYILELINIAQRELRVLLDLARTGAYLEQQRRTYAAAHHVLLRHESHLRAEMAAMGMPADSAGREMVEAASSLRALILHAGLPHPDAVANAAGAPPANAGPVAQNIVHQQPVPQQTVPQRAGAFVVPRSNANHQDDTTTRQPQPRGNSHTIEEEPRVAERANSEGSDWEPESDDEDEESDEQSSEDENGNGDERAQSGNNSDSDSSPGSDSDASSEDSEEWGGDDGE